MKKRASEKKHVSKSGILISSAFGLFISIITALSLFVIFSLIGLANENPHSLLSPVSFFTIYASAFFGGFSAIKKNKGRDCLLCGALCGIFISLTYSLVFGIIGFICNIDNAPISWVYRIIIIPITFFGSLIGIPKHHKQPKKRKFKR